MIKEALKALVGVGTLPKDPPKPTIFNLMLFAFLLMFGFLGTVLGLIFLVTLIIDI